MRTGMCIESCLDVWIDIYTDMPLADGNGMIAIRGCYNSIGHNYIGHHYIGHNYNSWMALTDE